MSTSVNLEQALENKSIILPRVMDPLGNYAYAAEHDGLVFVSGQTPTRDGRPVVTGHLGAEVEIAQGQEMARLTMLNVLAVLNHHLGGLSRVTRVLRLIGYVAAVPEFADHPLVLNGASDLLTDIWGEQGRHARAAVGVASLPQGAPVEIEAIVAVTTA